MNCGLAQQTQCRICTEGRWGLVGLRGQTLLVPWVSLRTRSFAWAVCALTVGTFEMQVTSLWSQWMEGRKPTCFAGKPADTTGYAYVRLVLVCYSTSCAFYFFQFRDGGWVNKICAERTYRCSQLPKYLQIPLVIHRALVITSDLNFICLLRLLNHEG